MGGERSRPHRGQRGQEQRGERGCGRYLGPGGLPDGFPCPDGRPERGRGGQAELGGGVKHEQADGNSEAGSAGQCGQGDMPAIQRVGEQDRHRGGGHQLQGWAEALEHATERRRRHRSQRQKGRQEGEPATWSFLDRLLDRHISASLPSGEMTNTSHPLCTSVPRATEARVSISTLASSGSAVTRARLVSLRAADLSLMSDSPIPFVRTAVTEASFSRRTVSETSVGSLSRVAKCTANPAWIRRRPMEAVTETPFSKPGDASPPMAPTRLSRNTVAIDRLFDSSCRIMRWPVRATLGQWMRRRSSPVTYSRIV